MREGFVEEVRSIAHNLFKVVLRLPGMLPSGFKILFGASKLVLDGLKTLHCTRIRCHFVELAIKCPDLLQQLFLKFIIGLLVK